MMPRALPLGENGAAAVSMAAIFSTLVTVVTATLSLETKLMALSLALGVLYLLQRVLVGRRRRSGHWLVQYGVLYMFQLIVPVQEDVLLVTNMRTYSLPYRPRGGYNYLIWPVFLGWVYLGWAWKPWIRDWQLRLYRLLQMGLNFGWFLYLLAKPSESTLDCQTKAVADYMKRESSKLSASSPFFDDDDANSNSSLQLLDSCRYPFVQGRNNGEWVTVKDLVQRDDLPIRFKKR